MSVKYYKPTTSSRRGMSVLDFSGLDKKKPERRLTSGIMRRAGRSSSSGRITVRHRGGGHKRLYRVIDFRCKKMGIPAKVQAIEYDPNRSSFITLIVFEDGEKRYIIAPDGLKVGEKIIFDQKTPIKTGNRMQLANIPPGTFVHNVELEPGRGGQIAKAAGSMVKILAVEGKFAHLKMPSGEVRKVLSKCMASLGSVSNAEHNNVVIGKAGRKRHMGWRPEVRGSAMNPVDHPHGGGEGRSGIGLRKGPKTRWGKQAFGVKTRRNKRTDKFIVKRR